MVTLPSELRQLIRFTGWRCYDAEPGACVSRGARKREVSGSCIIDCVTVALISFSLESQTRCSCGRLVPTARSLIHSCHAWAPRACSHLVCCVSLTLCLTCLSYVIVAASALFLSIPRRPRAPINKADRWPNQPRQTRHRPSRERQPRPCSLRNQ